MYIHFENDGFDIYFIKNVNTGNNEVIINQNNRFYGSIKKGIGRNWGNYWYKKLKEKAQAGEYGEINVDLMFLDFYIYKNDFDCYSDFFKELYYCRPHQTEEQWEKLVQEARNRKP